MMNPRSLGARIGRGLRDAASRIRLPAVSILMKQTGAVRIVCRPGFHGTGYRWNVRDLAAGSSGRAASYEEAVEAAHAAAEALAVPARHAISSSRSPSVCATVVTTSSPCGCT
jgi:hypothetical protein